MLAALTGADCLADGLKPIPHKPWSPHPAETPLSNRGGVPPFEAPHHPLPADKARFAGEAVAVVVGETLHAAKDGAERIDIDYEILPAVVETAAAARQDAPLVHDEPGSGRARSNVCFDAEIGDGLGGQIATIALQLSPREAMALADTLREIANGQVRYNESVEGTVNQYLAEKKAHGEATAPKRSRGTN